MLKDLQQMKLPNERSLGEVVESQKQILLSKDQARKFAENAHGLTLRYLDTEDGQVKVVFSESDRSKVEALVLGLTQMQNHSLHDKPPFQQVIDQFKRYETNIQMGNESGALRDFSFRVSTLADPEQTKVFTIDRKGSDQTYVTGIISKDDLIRDVKDQFGVSTSVANDLAEKSGAIGMLKDYEPSIQKMVQSVLVSRDPVSNEWVYSRGESVYRSLNEDKESTIQGIRNAFEVSNKEANVIYAKGMSFAKAQKDMKGVRRAMERSIQKVERLPKQGKPIISNDRSKEVR
jgi:hypothetical protein